MVIETLYEDLEEEEVKVEALLSGDDDRVEGVDEKEKMEEETKEEVGVEVEGGKILADD